MARRKSKLQTTIFEGDCKSEPFALMAISLLKSSAYASLTPAQKTLYVYCKMESTLQGDREKNPSFTMNQNKWSNVYKLYRTDNYKGFQRDMSALISHGFIECVLSGENTREANQYRLSAMWHNWGTADFVILENAKTSAMRRKERKS